MISEDLLKRLRQMRWRKDQAPQYKMVIRGVSREDERAIKQAAKMSGTSLSVFFAILAEAFRQGRVLIVPDGTDIDSIISGALVKRIDAAVNERVKQILADANLTDGGYAK
jgi:Na+/pantothenate symporter